jgi:hypothetical protein
VNAATHEPRATAGWPRVVLPEILDTLPPEDPRAIRSRGDLRRLNRIMGSLWWLLRALDALVREPPARIVELGGGDGTLLLRLARSRARLWPGVHATLLDLHPSASAATLDAIRRLGWRVDCATGDALTDLPPAPPSGGTVVLANLFVHHFANERLTQLLAAVGATAHTFVCCEPRRARLALAGSRLLGLIGCNAVTRHDAVISVHAGFRGTELSDAWRAACGEGWTLDERAAGPFSHVFGATRAP